MANRKLPVADDATPVIIAGAPRSGTTLLTTALNSHPQVMITNELRAWITLNDLRLRTEKPSESLPDHPLRERFRSRLVADFARLFRDFYREDVTKESLGCPAESGHSVERRIKAFGDKNPSYADTHAPGCLDFIAEAMPDAKFIHIYRDPRSCAASYKDIAIYANEVERWISIWKRHTQSMVALRDRLGPERVLELPYEDFVTERGEDIFQQIENHIGLDHALEPCTFLARERAEPIPYRSPTTPTNQLGRTTFHGRLTLEEIAAIEIECAALMKRLGYAALKADGTELAIRNFTITTNPNGK